MPAYPKYPRIVVDFTLERSTQCHRCGIKIPPFSRLYGIAISRESLGMKITCAGCAEAEMAKRETELAAAHAAGASS